MPNEIILLSGDVEGSHLGGVLREHNPNLKVIYVAEPEALRDACLAPGAGMRRLIAFCTSVIVPSDILSAVDGPAYNFHPGPPTYPGTHVAGFAIYDGATKFGATVHEMEASVDSGAIVGVDWFDIQDGLRFADLEILAYRSLVQLFLDLAPALATDDAPLPTLDMAWAEKTTTNKDAERMREIDDTMSEEEIKLRFRAFG
ncbi:MAG: hypothetical protein HOF27_07995 [Rhodospirillaceae bacterium]|nr:hypothetical protein [Rhodospirillaceae bacterium]